jgi:enolase
VKLYPIFSTLVDVFTGEGWENWTRISIKRGKIQVLAGNQLTAEEIAEIQRGLANA